ncbi:MAG: hypothetical protein ACIARR_08705 [Phycisphaerales bacterium JB059]
MRWAFPKFPGSRDATSVRHVREAMVGGWVFGVSAGPVHLRRRLPSVA